jgi:FAD/FMN-containing dehydrogenase
MPSLSVLVGICIFLQAGHASLLPPIASLSIRQTGLLGCLANKSIPLTVSTSANWNEYFKTYNIRLQYDPAVITIPETTRQVAESVICAYANGIKVQAKSGGHSYSSTSSGGKDGSMVIDLRHFQNVTVNEVTGVAAVGSGARLGNMALALNDKGRALAHGTCAGVGVGGHFTLGGYGYTSRAWGMALDQIVGLDVVMADGEIVYASPEENKDLYFVGKSAADDMSI